MIILDTHIWVKWVLDESQLPSVLCDKIREHETDGLGVSVISCWEVAKLIEVKRLSFEIDVHDWINQALSYPGIQLIDFSPTSKSADAKNVRLILMLNFTENYAQIVYVIQ